MLKLKPLPRLVISEHSDSTLWVKGIAATLVFIALHALLTLADAHIEAVGGLKERDRKLAEQRLEQKLVIHPEGWSCSAKNLPPEYEALVAKQCRDLALTIEAARQAGVRK